MQNIMNTAVLGLFFGTIGTTIGGIIGCSLKSQSNKFLSFILSFASGLMMSIICFDLIPEALGISEFSNVITGVVLGIMVMIICDIIVQSKLSLKKNKFGKNSLLKTGIACRNRASTS